MCSKTHPNVYVNDRDFFKLINLWNFITIYRIVILKMTIEFQEDCCKILISCLEIAQEVSLKHFLGIPIFSQKWSPSLSTSKLLAKREEINQQKKIYDPRKDTSKVCELKTPLGRDCISTYLWEHSSLRRFSLPSNSHSIFSGFTINSFT